MNEWGIRLDALGHYYPKLAQYQPKFLWGYSLPSAANKTTCNVFARDFLDSMFKTDEKSDWAKGIGGLITEYAYDISAINPGESIKTCILNTTIQSAHANLAAAARAGKVKTLTAEAAQAAANEGAVIHAVSGPYNHEAIICADPNLYDPKLGPLLTQAGAFCGVLYLGDKKTFGVYGSVNVILDKIGFYQYPEKT